MNAKFQIAGVQMDVELAGTTANLNRVTKILRDTHENGASLTIFPECVLTGYCFKSFDEAMAAAIDVDGPEINQLVDLCRKLSTSIVVGFLQRTENVIFNSAGLIGPDGLVGIYKKTHLPTLGVDRFTTAGQDMYEVHEINGLRIGMLICYDCSFPEPTRILSLAGADIIVLPTNWPPESGRTSDYVPNCRALENHVYFAAINRVGIERGVRFIGKSKICSPVGNDLACSADDDPTILIAEVDVQLARNKHLVFIPGEYEIHRFADRRPELYRSIIDPLQITTTEAVAKGR